MHGAVTQAGVRLLLKGAPGPAPQGEPVPDLVFVPVTWGQRRYLLRESEVFFFCRYVADGRGNETMARHLLREGDEKRPSSGLPRTLDGAPLCETPPVKRD
jgi:hypothetical protein